jgi:hypothetical protein
MTGAASALLLVGAIEGKDELAGAAWLARVRKRL